MKTSLITCLSVVLIAIVLNGCSSYQPFTAEDFSKATNAVEQATQTILSQQQDQIDLLAYEEFTQAQAALSKANTHLKSGNAPDKVLQNTAIANRLLKTAEAVAKPKKASASRILDTRASVLSAGVKRSQSLTEELASLDQKLRKKTKKFSRALSPKDFSDFQKKYLSLEIKAVQFRELNNAKLAIDKAKKQKADDVAASTLKTALLDYATAVNTIAQSPRSEDLYRKDVNIALESATLLVDVMEVITGAQGTPEHIALQIVEQKRALGEMSTTLKSTQQTLQEKEGVLKNQEEQLARASTQVRFQKAMDEARETISEEYALVYQQGNQLVFRLKRMNFPTGGANIPSASKRLLSKVAAIIDKLDAEEVVVQGHTDSVGSAGINQNLSQERAKAVAYFLSSRQNDYRIRHVGYGESYPIASNETEEGRAINRRVDLVLSVKQ